MAMYTKQDGITTKKYILNQTQYSKEAIDKSIRLIQLDNNEIREKFEEYIKQINIYINLIEQETNKIY